MMQQCANCGDGTPQWVLDEMEHEVAGLGHIEDTELIGWSETDAGTEGSVRHIVYRYNTPAWETGTGIKFDPQTYIRFRTFTVDGKGERSGGMGGSI